MTMPLSPCPSCARHIRVNEARCPFCAASIERKSAPGQGAAAFFVGVTLVLAGCNTHTEQPHEQPKPTEAKPTPLETTKTPETKPDTGLTPTPSTNTLIPSRPAVPAYGHVPVPPEYITPPVAPRPATKYGAPPPPHNPMKP